jgi:hypothetical protein
VQQRDYLERMIERVVAAVAHIIGLARDGHAEEAGRELDDAWGSLGLRENDALRLDDATLHLMLGARAELAGRLLEARAEIEEARGETASASNIRKRALALTECPATKRER